MSRLTTEPVLIVDCQTTGSSPSSGDLLELGWGIYRASESIESFREKTTHHLLKPQSGTVPRRISDLTGITDDHLSRAKPPETVWAEFHKSLNSTDYLVAHYSQFEKRFLDDLARRQGDSDKINRPIICTHELTRRVLEGLPRKGIRPVAGYWGHSLPEEKRTHHHVPATAFIWKKLVQCLESDHGLKSVKDLNEWIQTTEPDSGDHFEYLIDRDRRLSLPEKPGVYRMLNRNNQVLYVGKAKSLKSRVNSYFQSGSSLSESKLEMVSQVDDVEVESVETPLEASLLEVDQIREHSPPYNSKFVNDGRSILYVSRDLRSWATVPDPSHSLGPVDRKDLINQFRIIWDWIRQPDNPCKANSDRLSTLYEPDQFEEGLRETIRAWDLHQLKPGLEEFLDIGLKLWRQDTETDRNEAGNQATKSNSDGRTAMEPAVIRNRIENVVKWGTRAIRRGNWFRRIQSANIYWKPVRGKTEPWRHIKLVDGSIQTRQKTEEVRPSNRKEAHDTPSRLTVPEFDRLRVLTRELKRLTSEPKPVRVLPGSDGTEIINGRELASLLENF